MKRLLQKKVHQKKGLNLAKRQSKNMMSLKLFLFLNKSMEVALLASMRIEVGFDQGPSMNVINFKIICRCHGKNVFKYPYDDDTKGFVSSFGTLESAMLSLSMTCHCHRLNFIVIFGTKMEMQQNRLLHSSSREEEPDFDHICICSPNQSKLDSCFGDNQYIVCSMNRDETSHEVSFNIIVAMFHHFIAQNIYYFNVCTFIVQQTLEDWKLCRHNHGHHGTASSLISEIVEMKEMNDISIHDCIKTRWTDLYPQDDTEDDSDLHLLYSSLHICMIDW